MNWRRPAGLALVAALLADGAGAAEKTYAVVAPESRFRIHVGRAGLFKFAGHEHEVLAPAIAGRIVADPEALERSSVSLDFDSAALEVGGEGEPPEDVPKVREAMLGPKVLDAAQFPAIRFRSTGVSGKARAAGGAYELQLQGELNVRGVARPVTMPLRVELSGERLVARGKTTLRQSSFGITPISVAGVVKVKDELAVEFEIVARAEEAASSAQQVP